MVPSTLEEGGRYTPNTAAEPPPETEMQLAMADVNIEDDTYGNYMALEEDYANEPTKDKSGWG